MRRMLLPALCAGLVAAPIPVAIAAIGPDDTGHTAEHFVKQHRTKVHLRKEAREQMRAARRRAAEKKRAAAAPAIPSHLAAIAQCESGGNPRAVGGGGMYLGKYQFSVATWRGVGGAGSPLDASEAEQDKRAAILYARSGPSQWPVCGS